MGKSLEFRGRGGKRNVVYLGRDSEQRDWMQETRRETGTSQLRHLSLNAHQNSGAEEVVQHLKSLLIQIWRLELSSQHPCNKPTVPISLSFKGPETGLLGLASFQCSGEKCETLLKGVGREQEETQHPLQASAYACVHNTPTQNLF